MEGGGSTALLDDSIFGEDDVGGYGGGSNALLLMPRKPKEKKSGGPKKQQQELQQRHQQKKPNSTRKQRKLQQLLKKHTDKDLKAELCKELEKHQLKAITKPLEESAPAAIASDVIAPPGDSDNAALTQTAAGTVASAAGIHSEEVQLAKAQLLLGGGLLLTGVKGRRLQKKARKALLVQQEMQQRQHQLQMQRQLKAQQQTLLEQNQQQTKSTRHSETSKEETQPTQQPVQQQNHDQKQQQQQQQQSHAVQHLEDNNLKNQAKSCIAATAASNSSSGSSSCSSSKPKADPATSAKACPVAAGRAGGGTTGGGTIGMTVAGGARGGKVVQLPTVSFCPETATRCLHRCAAIEAARASLPAAEAEGRVLSFLLQQQHPSSRDAEDCRSSSSDEGHMSSSLEAPCKRKRKRFIDHANQRHADVLCVAGSTGSGKSTQIPQFVFESGICYPEMLFHKKCQAARQLLQEETAVGPQTSNSADPGDAPAAPEAAIVPAAAAVRLGVVSAEATKQGILVRRQLCICITQPRRVAAVSLARRVAEEMGSQELVGYQVRHDKHNVGPRCRLKFATDGVLLREIQEDFLLRKYCCIVVDEAHERNINVDLLLGLLSRVVTLRRERFMQEKDTLPPLKVLIMSATLRATDFTANAHLFSPPPALLTLESRTFEVRVHFSKKTPDRYVQAAVKKALQIHTRLPAGSVLVFLTGRSEVLEAVKMLQEWQQRRERKLRFSSATATVAAAAEDESNEETASEAEFLLSDQSEDEPLPLEEKAPGSSDSDVSLHSQDSGASQSRGRWRHKPGLPDKLLELALGSDAEDNEESQDGVKEAEAAVLQAVLSASRASPSVQGSPGGVPKTGDGTSSTGAGERGSSEVTAGDTRDDPKAARKSRIVETRVPGNTLGGTNLSSADCMKSAQVTEGKPRSHEATPGASAAHTLTATFDAPDMSKRRNQKGVPEGGWLGAGALRRKKPSEGRRHSSSTGEVQEGARLSDAKDTEESEETHSVPRLTVLPLYATLPRELQRLAFEPPSPDERRVIVATNVAETSLTLPNVRYVVDSGREKRRIFTGSEGFSYFTVTLTTQAAAQQRTGRAGRVGAGVCYRLYSSAVFQHDMEPHPTPQIHTVPLDHLLLFMAALGIPRPSAFPFPSPPPGTALANARRRLVALGALEPKSNLSAPRRKQQRNDGREPEVCCTALGRRMSEVPIPPRFAKILLLACSRHKEHGPQFVALACYLVAALSIGELLPTLPREGEASDPGLPGSARSPGRRPWQEYDSDLDAYIWLCGAYSHAKNPISFCKSYGVDASRLAEVGALAAQLAQLMRTLLQQARRTDSSQAAEADLEVLKAPLRLEPPAPEARRCLHQCVVQGLIDHVAAWQDPPRLPPDASPAQRAAARGGYRCAELKGELARVHCTSNILHVSPRPKLLVYNQLIHTGRGVLQVCHPIDDVDLSSSDTPLVQHSFLQLPAPAYDPRRDAVVGWSRPTYGPLQLPLPAVERPLPRIRDPVASPLSTQEQQQQQQLYACFAAALVAGRAIPRLKKFGPSLSVTAEGMLAGSCSGTFAVRAFVAELAKREVASRAELLKLWKSEPKFLLAEFVGLLRSYNYETLQDVHDIWPPV